ISTESLVGRSREGQEFGERPVHRCTRNVVVAKQTSVMVDCD
ncbi:1126_t:CDS:1, partial [Paraglomus occultum]